MALDQYILTFQISLIQNAVTEVRECHGHIYITKRKIDS